MMAKNPKEENVKLGKQNKGKKLSSVSLDSKLEKQTKIEFEDMEEALKNIQKQREQEIKKKKKKKKEPEEVYLFEKKEPVKKQPKQKTKQQVKKKSKEQPKKQPKKEIKEPKKRKRVSKWVKYSVILVLLIVAIIVVMYSPLFHVQKLEVEGNGKISKEEIISLSQIQTGESTYKISKAKVEENIKQNPYIESVTVKRKLPDEVSLIVKERITTFMLEYGGGYVYLNNQGYMLEISTQKLQVPILQGGETLEEEIKIGNRLCKEDLNKMSRVLRIIESASNIGIESLISKIDISNKDNYKLIFDSEAKTAYLGDESNLSTKMLYIKALLEDNKTIPGEIFVNMDLNTGNPFFRKQV